MDPVTMETMPNLVLSTIFSLLDFPSLIEASQVCKRWKGLIEAGDAWQEFRETHTGEIPPCRGSLAERCRVLRNWRHGIGEMTELPAPESVQFAVLEDNTIIEMYDEVKPGGSCLTVRNMATKEIIGSIELQGSMGVPPMVIARHGTSLTMLAETGVISRFDLRTCTLISKIQGEAPSELSGTAMAIQGHIVSVLYGNIISLRCTDQELVIGRDDQKISIWNVKTGGARTIEVSGYGGSSSVASVASTSHFVFATQHGDRGTRVISIRKSDQKQELLEEVDSLIEIDSESVYFAFLIESLGQLKIYKDVSEHELKLIHNCRSLYTTQPSFTNGNIRFIKNWLVAALGRSLLVWDLKEGVKVSSMILQGREVRQLDTNGETLCTQSFHNEDALAVPIIDSRYCLYSFVYGLTKVGEPIEHPTSLAGRLCVIQ